MISISRFELTWYTSSFCNNCYIESVKLWLVLEVDGQGRGPNQRFWDCFLLIWLILFFDNMRFLLVIRDFVLLPNFINFFRVLLLLFYFISYLGILILLWYSTLVPIQESPSLFWRQMWFIVKIEYWFSWNSFFILLGISPFSLPQFSSLFYNTIYYHLISSIELLVVV